MDVSEGQRDNFSIYPPDETCLNKVALWSWQGIRYNLLKRLGAGGKGLAFTAEQHGGSRDGTTVVVKIPNLNLRDFTEDQVRIRVGALMESFRAEIDPAKDLAKLPGVAAIIDGGVAQWSITHKHRFTDVLPFAVYDFVPGDNLNDWCERKYSVSGQFMGITDPEVWFKLTKQLLHIMQAVHHQRIIHGDLWPENIRINDEENITVIDFGESWKMDTLREQDPDFASSKRHAYLAPERLRSEFNPRRRWYTPADIYSIGGILHYLATGQPPPAPLDNGGVRKNRDVKDDVIRNVLSANQGLYRANPGVVDIISICIHPKVEDRVSRISPILDTVESFSPHSIDHPESADMLSLVDNEISALSDSVKRLRQSSSVHPVFQRLVLSRVQQLRDEIAPLEKNLFVLEGDRETHINGLLTCLDSLLKGDQVIAVTSSQFWKPGNFGPYGRLLTKLITSTERGVNVSWVVLTHHEPTDIDKEVVRYHKHAIENLCKRRRPTDFDEIVGKGKPLYIGYCPSTAEEIDLMRKARNAFILLRQGDKWLLIAPDYCIGDYGSAVQSISVETTVTSLRIWADARRTENLKEKHEEYFAKSESVLSWRL